MKKIPLTQGKFALVDDEDFERLNQWKWQFTGGYVRRTVYHGTDENGKRIREVVWMHKLVVSCPPNFVVDHKDGNPLNNQKENLRICTGRENLYNQRKQASPASSSYKGVTLQHGKFLARLRVKGRLIVIGYFTDETAAACAYNHYAQMAFGEYASLNTVPVMEKEEWLKYRTSRKELPNELC